MSAVYDKLVEIAEAAFPDDPSPEAAYDERFKILSAAYCLGGAAALVPLLKRYETIACVRCGGDGKDPVRRVKVLNPLTRPGDAGKLIPGPEPEGCILCNGSGIITQGEIRAALKEKRDN